MRVNRRRSPSSRSRALRAAGIQLGPVAFQDADGGRQGGEWRAQLVAHVRGEAGFPFDAILEVGRHPVEGRGQLLEVDVVTGLDPGVEVAAGDGHGGVGHPGQRPEGPAGGPPPSGRPGQGGDQGGRGQGEGQGAQRAVQLVEREDLEVGGMHRGQGDADDQLGGAADREEL